MSDQENWKQQDQPSGNVVSPADEEAGQLPLGVGDNEFDDNALLGLDNSFARPKRSVSNGVLLLLLVLVVGGGTLWFMRVTGAVSTETKDLAEIEQRINTALAEFLGNSGASRDEATQAIDELFKDTDDAIAVFADDPTANQVGVDDVQKNPFELFVKPRSEEPTPAVDRSALDRTEMLRRELEKLTLQSILSGKSSMAVISDGAGSKVYGEGDTVGPFTIASISPYGVRLTADGNTYTLRMAEPEIRQ